MSRVKERKRITKADLQQRKGGAKISMVTCYDSAFARIIDKSPIDCVLVGDSLGNVMLGYEDTLKVSIDEMIHHTAATARGLTIPMLIADMPFGSYQASDDDALQNAIDLVKQGGAQAVKVEGAGTTVDRVQAIVSAGIPVVGHLGFTPQKINEFGGYRVQGRGEAAGRQILEDAKKLEQAGCFMLVLEMVPDGIARQITELLKIPVIGIGAGLHCDGQVLVIHDLLGFDDEFSPKFLKKYADLNGIIRGALDCYDNDVKNGTFPSAENSYAD